MGRGMTAVHVPSAAEQDNIVTYLQEHALRPAGEQPAESPETPELALFRQTCSRCHALPDSASHAPDEWPSVVERMRKNMENMARPGISDQERDAIVRYLQEHASR
jgi:mono/diheme cytochrome c family protein